MLEISIYSLTQSIFYQRSTAQFCQQSICASADVLSLKDSKIVIWERVKSLLNDENLDWSKLKVFADNQINANKYLKFGLKRVENIVGKGENAGY